MNAPPTISLIAVVGGSGAGKGWVVERLCRLLGENAVHLELDSFYRDRSHLPLSRRARCNFDLPAAIDWPGAERVLRQCRAGETARVPSYDFATHRRLEVERCCEPRPLMIVDGLWLLRRPAVRRLFDLKIYLDAPPELRCARRLARDVAQRGYTPAFVDRLMRTAVIPMHARYVEPQKRWADLVLRQPFIEADLVALAHALWRLIAHSGLPQTRTPEAFQADLLELFACHEYCN